MIFVQTKRLSGIDIASLIEKEKRTNHILPEVQEAV